VQLDVFDVEGKLVELLTLPDCICGSIVNKKLLAQAVRVRLANERQGTASTKTRGEVDGSTRKIYRQKGTGKARHGGIRAPIFVHGGIAFGPRPRDHSLKLPTQMKRKALFSAITSQYQDHKVLIVDTVNLGSKTSEAYSMLKALNLLDKKRNGNKVLFIVNRDTKNVVQASRNLAGVTLRPAQQMTTYEGLNSNCVLFVKDAVATLADAFLKERTQ